MGIWKKSGYYHVLVTRRVTHLELKGRVPRVGGVPGHHGVFPGEHGDVQVVRRRGNCGGGRTEYYFSVFIQRPSCHRNINNNGKSMGNNLTWKPDHAPMLPLHSILVKVIA